MINATRPDTGTRGRRVPAAVFPPVRLTLSLLVLASGFLLTVTAAPPMPAEGNLVAETTRDTTAGYLLPTRHWYSMYPTGDQNADIYRFETPVNLTSPYPPRAAMRQQRLRNARARKRLERLSDRKQLRRHVEEVWNRADA